MKYLETCKTNPHESFFDYSDDFLTDYIKDVFDIEFNDINPIKDSINIYSYLVNNEIPPWEVSHTYIVPIDGDILNAAVSNYIKLTTRMPSSNAKGNSNIKIIEYSGNLLNLDLTSSVDIVTKTRYIKSIADLTKVNYSKHVLPEFKYKTAIRRHVIEYKEEDTTKEGYVYIDNTYSMYHKRESI